MRRGVVAILGGMLFGLVMAGVASAATGYARFTPHAAAPGDTVRVALDSVQLRWLGQRQPGAATDPRRRRRDRAGATAPRRATGPVPICRPDAPGGQVLGEREVRARLLARRQHQRRRRCAGRSAVPDPRSCTRHSDRVARRSGSRSPLGVWRWPSPWLRACWPASSIVRRPLPATADRVPIPRRELGRITGGPSL